MIISASRRTDIPAFFSRWFERRVQEGYLCVRNPMNNRQVSKISLDPAVIDCIVFWTKNPLPMLGRLDSFSPYPYYFQFTLTGYGKDVEAHLPDKQSDLIPAFKRLADAIGPERVIWRYDPILFTEKYTPDYHLHALNAIARKLEGYTEKCVISFVDVYRNIASTLKALGVFSLEPDELVGFAGRVAEIAGERGISVATCAEAIDLSRVGIKHNCCIDPVLIGRIAQGELAARKDKSQRLECGCVNSIDIGTYNTCGNGCRYCYANSSFDAMEKSRAAFDWMSPMLCDAIRETDTVTERPMKRLLIRGATQPMLFDASDFARDLSEGRSGAHRADAGAGRDDEG